VAPELRGILLEELARMGKRPRIRNDIFDPAESVLHVANDEIRAIPPQQLSIGFPGQCHRQFATGEAQRIGREERHDSDTLADQRDKTEVRGDVPEMARENNRGRLNLAPREHCSSAEAFLPRQWSASIIFRDVLVNPFGGGSIQVSKTIKAVATEHRLSHFGSCKHDSPIGENRLRHGAPP
jgi:hypothetical protein